MGKKLYKLVWYDLHSNTKRELEFGKKSEAHLLAKKIKNSVEVVRIK